MVAPVERLRAYINTMDTTHFVFNSLDDTLQIAAGVWKQHSFTEPPILKETTRPEGEPSSKKRKTEASGQLKDTRDDSVAGKVRHNTNDFHLLWKLIYARLCYEMTEAASSWGTMILM
jgi:hypothetical protein